MISLDVKHRVKESGDRRPTSIITSLVLYYKNTFGTPVKIHATSQKSSDLVYEKMEVDLVTFKTFNKDPISLEQIIVAREYEW
uniref:Uncharacterized protein n=1 Tax=Timema poppense TaxID=170557 RepID=A0A7R9CXD0_TIMPO|nr:unnamed protein product [Timema poppensis]